MVEKLNSSSGDLVERVSQIRICKVCAGSLEDDLLVMEMRVGWTALSDAQKIKQAVADAEVAITRWHKGHQLGAAISYEGWVDALKKEFGAGKMSLGEYASQRQGLKERASVFVKRMTKLGDSLGLSRGDPLSVIKTVEWSLQFIN
ncbi:hypothetical protein PAPHI01_2614 [Pancytospora philotis]|nr:hypothetical protein PAPHI01_2614 [Pancytospora philotis]